ncbi:hypothetical protein GCM10023196_021360 [Actinoallomurus vinaceus]|uniref:Radical SAM core domain-containing protein n=1 Tax=Actinoallomurus vinaceus TaxID=1080074 RepID=A0ABP8U4W1_9ACTN
MTFRLQTNGVLLTPSTLDVLLEHDIAVGVSLDGGREAHDRHCRYANGRGSYDAVVEGIERLRQDPYRRLFSHLYCTIDVANDPLATYEELLRFEPPFMDFLLPEAIGRTRRRGSTSTDPIRLTRTG